MYSAKPRPCGCKGLRTCLICELNFGAERQDFNMKLQNKEGYVYCPYCKDKAWIGWKCEEVLKMHPNHIGKSVDYPGVLVITDFLSEKEANNLMNAMDNMEWDISQSGRRKQNFGPKCNFKKKKLVMGNFKGFPEFSYFVQEKLKCVELLKDFQTIEQCSLEYCESRGSSIDPHIDDCWIWGERIVTVNIIGDSVLTMTCLQEKDKNRYNLEYAPNNLRKCQLNDIVVRIPMPARSLIVMHGAARYQWEHSVLREDIIGRRVCLAYREFTTPYLPGGQQFASVASQILHVAKTFW